LPWAKGIVLEGGFIHTMRCRVGLLTEGKDKIVGCKWDTLIKHQGRRIVHHDLPILGVKKGGEYIAKDCAHLKNMKLYVQRGLHSIFTRITTPISEESRKNVQMKTLLHVLSNGRPMLKYETMHDLFVTLGVPNTPLMH
jgi:hypothetical protein